MMQPALNVARRICSSRRSREISRSSSFETEKGIKRLSALVA